MKRDPKKVLQKALKNIEEDQKIVFLTDVYGSLGISATQFYKLFPKGSEDYNTISEALELNKINMKREIRDRLAESDKPYSLLILYRLLADDFEREALNPPKDYNKKDTKQEETIELEVQ